VEVIRTKRLMLRDLEEADWQAVHDYASDPEVVRYMNWGPNTEEETRDFIQRAFAGQDEQPRRNYTLAIVLRNEDMLIDGCSINVSNPNNREGWIGYCLNQHFWGRGYATETAKALTYFGFDKPSLHRIFATCDPANAASARVLEKVGMKCEGHIREHVWAKGKWRGSLLYAILEQKYVRARADQR
jgi:ribosomal-protein-alanine N-acetyltransferase